MPHVGFITKTRMCVVCDTIYIQVRKRIFNKYKHKFNDNSTMRNVPQRDKRIKDMKVEQELDWHKETVSYVSTQHQISSI